MTKHEDPTSAKSEVGPVLCGCGDKLPVGTYYVDDVSPVHVHHGRTECHICDHPDRADARTPVPAEEKTWRCPLGNAHPAGVGCGCLVSVPAADQPVRETERANTYCAYCGTLRDHCEHLSDVDGPCCRNCTHAAPAPITEEEERCTGPGADHCPVHPFAPVSFDASATLDSTGKPTVESLIASNKTLRKDNASYRQWVERILDALGVSPTSDEPLMETIIRQIERLKAERDERARTRGL